MKTFFFEDLQKLELKIKSKLHLLNTWESKQDFTNFALSIYPEHRYKAIDMFIGFTKEQQLTKEKSFLGYTYFNGQFYNTIAFIDDYLVFTYDNRNLFSDRLSQDYRNYKDKSFFAGNGRRKIWPLKMTKPNYKMTRSLFLDCLTQGQSTYFGVLSKNFKHTINK